MQAHNTPIPTKRTKIFGYLSPCCIFSVTFCHRPREFKPKGSSVCLIGARPHRTAMRVRTELWSLQNVKALQCILCLIVSAVVYQKPPWQSDKVLGVAVTHATRTLVWMLPAGKRFPHGQRANKLFPLWTSTHSRNKNVIGVWQRRDSYDEPSQRRAYAYPAGIRTRARRLVPETSALTTRPLCHHCIAPPWQTRSY